MTERAPAACISRNALYPLEEFERILGWKRTSIRRYRRRGFIVRYIGHTAFVFGDEALQWIRANSVTNRGEKLRGVPPMRHKEASGVLYDS